MRYILALFVLMAGWCAGASLYVDPDNAPNDVGVRDGSPNTAEDHWQKVNTAIAAADSDDVIYCMSGTYNATTQGATWIVTFDNSEDSHTLTVMPYDDASITWNFNDGSWVAYRIYITAASANITIQDIVWTTTDTYSARVFRLNSATTEVTLDGITYNASAANNVVNVLSGARLNIVDCSLTENSGNTVVYIEGAMSDGLYVSGSTISNPKTAASHYGIAGAETIACPNVSIVDSTIKGNSAGFKSYQWASRIFSQNSIYMSLATSAASPACLLGYEYGQVTTWDNTAGSHITTDNSATLKVAASTFVASSLIGCTVTNTTNNCSGVVTANTATEVTFGGGLSGGDGGENDFDIGDGYKITFDIGTLVSNDGQIYRCIEAHDRTTADSEPGVGAIWQRYWAVIDYITATFRGCTFSQNTTGAGHSFGAFWGTEVDLFGCSATNGDYQFVLKGAKPTISNCYATGANTLAIVAQNKAVVSNNAFFPTAGYGIGLVDQVSVYGRDIRVFRNIISASGTAEPFSDDSNPSPNYYCDENIYYNSATSVLAMLGGAQKTSLSAMQAYYESGFYSMNDKNSKNQNPGSKRGLYLDMDSNGTKEWVGIPQNGSSSGGIFGGSGIFGR